MPTRSGRIQNSNLDRPRSPGGGPAPGNSGSDRAGVGWVSNPTGTSSSAQSGSRFGLGPGGFQIRPPRPALGTRTPLGNRHRLPVRFPIRLRRSADRRLVGFEIRTRTGLGLQPRPAAREFRFRPDMRAGAGRFRTRPNRSRVGFEPRSRSVHARSLVACPPDRSFISSDQLRRRRWAAMCYREARICGRVERLNDVNGRTPLPRRSL